MLCPICRRKARYRSWQDDVAGAAVTTETLIECFEGHYRDSYSYGLFEVVIGDRQFGWRYDTPEDQVKQIEAQIATESAIVRDQWRRRVR